ncbi:hypothetical protein M3Y94_00479900 [Aphelenchoides besseyi]|nr:hypothetical protein M3Y94_00479900 [Aphelenchoides besseyi]KAI6219880.1 hypothetical protein M3Y95_01074200 [Aphelenchoides besseyi]
MSIDYAQIDQLFDSDKHDESQKMLMEHYKDNEESVELLWRLARTMYFLSVDDKKKHKDTMYEGQKYAAKGHELDAANFECLRWASILTGSISDISGQKEKIQQGNLFKEYLDKALALQPDEFTLLHMSGRLAYSVANLTWIERKLATTLYEAPPEGSMDEAIEKFQKVADLKPDWIENLLYLAKAFIGKSAKQYKSELAKVLKQCVELTPTNAADRQAQEEAKPLLKKYGS